MLTAMRHGIGLSCLTVYGFGGDNNMKKVICLVLIFTVFLLSACSVKSNDIQTYGSFRKYLPAGQDIAYAIFPENIPFSAENINYIFEYKETLLDPEIQLYLEYELSTEDYYKEIERIKEVKIKQTVKPDFSKSNYLYPTYVAVENYDSGFEYVTASNRIVTLSALFPTSTFLYLLSVFLSVWSSFCKRREPFFL